MNDDAPDVLCLLEAEGLPRDAAVGGLVDAPPWRDAVARIPLARAGVEDLRITRRNRDIAHRRDGHVFPKWDEGRAGVDRLPDTAGRASDVKGFRILRVAFDVCDTTGHVHRADRAPTEGGERRRI